MSDRPTEIRSITIGVDRAEKNVQGAENLALTAEPELARLRLLVQLGSELRSIVRVAEVYGRAVLVIGGNLGEWCEIRILEPDGTHRSAAVYHPDPVLISRLTRLSEEGAFEVLWDSGRVMRSARSERILDISLEDLRRARTEGDVDFFELAPTWAAVAPMVAGGRVFGSITVGGSSSTASDADLARLEQLASMVASAAEVAELVESRSEVARALQAALAPPLPPQIEGVEVAARFLVAATGLDVGGDFYEIFEADGCWFLLLGDVCGHGLEAAATTGMFRHSVRAVAAGKLSPARILAATNDAILGQIDESLFATALLASARVSEGGAAVTIASGGHPRPLLIRASGSIERVEVTGMLLGVLPGPDLEDVEITLAPGDALVMFTDGALEARHGGEHFGEKRLREALVAAGPFQSAEAIADALVAAVEAFTGDSTLQDDLALVVLRLR